MQINLRAEIVKVCRIEQRGGIYIHPVCFSFGLEADKCDALVPYSRPRMVIAIAAPIKSMPDTSRIARPPSTHLTKGKVYSSDSGENWCA